LGIETDTFPTLTDQLVKQKLREQKLYNVHDLQFLEENLQQAIAVNDSVMIEALQHIKHDFQMRALMKQADELILHGYAHKLKQLLVRH
jgi:hypothetical protein